MSKDYDIVIVGAGIVGLATAYQIKKYYRSKKILIIEKEKSLGMHQSGRNSGVIHSGIYYKENSFKAKNCINGYSLLVKYCKKKNINYEICGKVIVATSEKEKIQLRRLLSNANKNGLKNVKLWNREQLKEREPYCEGLEALYVPQTGIINYGDVLNTLFLDLKRNGSEISFNEKVYKFNSTISDNLVEIVTSKKTIYSKLIITCNGLQSDRLFLNKTYKKFKIIPFKGEYYELKKEAREKVKHLIYPTPDPNFPFLGVHFTRMLDNNIECGPNAVLSFSREGYKKLSLNIKDTYDILSWPGFYKFAYRNFDKGFQEYMRSVNKRVFLNSLQRLVPSISLQDLKTSNCGIRAQACDLEGNLIDDFVIERNGRILSVINAPSPAATSSFSIGMDIMKKIKNLI